MHLKKNELNTLPFPMDQIIAPKWPTMSHRGLCTPSYLGTSAFYTSRSEEIKDIFFLHLIPLHLLLPLRNIPLPLPTLPG